MKLAGIIILLVIEIIALVSQGFSYTLIRQDAKLGPVEINHQETHPIPVPPIVGGVCLAAGALALAAGTRGKM
jgi:hypothetical protein